MQILRGWKELFIIFILAVISAYAIRTFFLAPYRVPTGSMQPALKPGDFIFVSQVAYGLRIFSSERFWPKVPERGDVVTFQYAHQPQAAHVKRVLGLPGDRIEMKGNQLILNGLPLSYTKLDESEDNPNPDLFEIFREEIEGVSWRVIYKKIANKKEAGKKGFGPIVVPPGHVFLIGDNRDASDDSRYWGTVPIEQIFGRVSVVWLSLDWQKKWARHNLPTVRWQRIFSPVR